MDFESSPFPSGVEGEIDTLNLALDKRVAEADIRAHRVGEEDTRNAFQIYHHIQDLVDLQRELYENPHAILWMPADL